jgi:hypothetical protein
MRLASCLVQVACQRRREEQAANGGGQVHHTVVAGKVAQPKQLRRQHLRMVWHISMPLQMDHVQTPAVWRFASVHMPFLP